MAEAVWELPGNSPVPASSRHITLCPRSQASAPILIIKSRHSLHLEFTLSDLITHESHLDVLQNYETRKNVLVFSSKDYVKFSQAYRVIIFFCLTKQYKNHKVEKNCSRTCTKLEIKPNFSHSS